MLSYMEKLYMEEIHTGYPIVWYKQKCKKRSPYGFLTYVKDKASHSKRWLVLFIGGFMYFFYSPLDTLVPEKYHRLKSDWRCSRFTLLSKYKAMSYDPHDTWFLWVCVRIASSLPSFPLLFSIQSSPPSHSGNVPLPIASPLRLTKAVILLYFLVLAHLEPFG